MDSKTLLLRQVHPSFVQADGISVQVFSITSQVFRPTPKDNHKLSVYNGDKFTPIRSFEHFTDSPLNKSIGVVAVSCQECQLESLPYEEDNIPFDGHSVIDFNLLGSNEIEKKSKKLKKAALDRGWLHKL